MLISPKYFEDADEQQRYDRLGRAETDLWQSNEDFKGQNGVIAVGKSLLGNQRKL